LINRSLFVHSSGEGRQEQSFISSKDWKPTLD
jgi:hypothetical protein